MIKKTCISIIVTLILVASFSLNVNAADAITITDPVDDVSDITLEDANMSRPSVDITEVYSIRNGKEIELKLKLAEGGTIQSSSLTHLYMYTIGLQTSKEEYGAVYTGLDFSSISPEDLGVDDISEYSNLDCYVQTTSMDYLDVNSYSGAGENELSIKFDLLDSDEIIIAVYGVTMEYFGNFSYFDECSGEELTIDTTTFFDIQPGEIVDFEAVLDEGTASDYEWLWVFEENGIELTGVQTNYTFKLPGQYEGIVYVYDDEGNWGLEQILVNVTSPADAKKSKDSGTPGFEIITIILLIAAIVVFKRK